MKKKIILIGLGSWGKTWVKVLRKSEYWNTVGYVEKDKKNLKEAASKLKIDNSNCYTSLKDAIEDKNPEAAMVVVPPSLHASVIENALENNLHVLTEKPMTNNLDDAKKLVSKAEETNKNFMVSQDYRYFPDARVIKNLISEKKLGKTQKINIEFYRPPSKKWRKYGNKEEGFPLLDMSIHHFDMIRFFLDKEAERIYTDVKFPEESITKGCPTYSTYIKMEDETMINYVLSFSFPWKKTSWNGIWRIDCSKGQIKWEKGKIKTKTCDKSLYTEITPESLEKENIISLKHSCSLEGSGWGKKSKKGRLNSLKEFYKSIKENREPETSGKDNINSLNMSLSAIESSSEEKKIDIRKV